MLRARGKILPEIIKVNFHRNMPLKTHRTIRVKIQWASENPLEHIIEQPLKMSLKIQGTICPSSAYPVPEGIYAQSPYQDDPC